MGIYLINYIIFTVTDRFVKGDWSPSLAVYLAIILALLCDQVHAFYWYNGYGKSLLNNYSNKSKIGTKVCVYYKITQHCNIFSNEHTSLYTIFH